MPTMLEWALYYQSLGFPVIPINKSIKRPHVEWKEYQQTKPTTTELNNWWKIWPNADVGIVTGPIAGRLILDFDGEEGMRTFHSRKWSVSQLVKTRNGVQIHYNWDSRLEACKTTLVKPFPIELPGVDSRGRGGYTKMVPSLFSDASGRYEWINDLDTPLKNCPEDIIQLLLNRKETEDNKRKESNDSWLQEKLNGLKNGNRNSTFTSIAGSFRSRGYSADDIFNILEPHARAVDFPLEELETISESVGSYPTKVVSEDSESFAKFLEHEEKTEWIVPGLIARNSLNFAAGWPMTSKTWMLMDLAIEAAKGGGYWLGKFPVKKSKVLFIDQERFRGETQRRFKALTGAKSLSPSSIQEFLKVKCGTTIRLNLQQSFDAFRRELAEYKPDLVIVDSFATFHTAAENDRMEIQKVLELIKQLRTEFGCSFIFINHENKGIMNKLDNEETRLPSMTDMAGSIGISAAAEMMLTVRRKDAGTCVVYNTKNSLANALEPFNLVVEDLDEAKSKIRVRAY